MYRLDWIERIKARPNESRTPVRLRALDPVVWKLGCTSLLTDISSEMVNSLLPVYIVLHLHMSPLQFGAIDGIYNGVAIALLSLAGGFLADRWRRQKEVAVFGYGLSAICKILLLALGTTWGWLATIIALDRAGKGARTAPRDALISLATPADSLASAFAVHRALDAGGALLGPILAFVLLSRLPNAFDAVWATSFVFAILGLGVLWLFVQNPPRSFPAENPTHLWRRIFSEIDDRRFWKLLTIGGVLSIMTLSDGFLYLLLQQRSGLTLGFFPLFYVVTACFYMLLAIPLGRIADRHGRAPVLLGGYAVVGLIYLYLLLSSTGGLAGNLICLLLFGFYYAATEGVLVAMISQVIPAEFRASGLALLATAVSTGKFLSSLLFGWLWQSWGTQVALSALAWGLLGALIFSFFWLRQPRHAQLA